MGIKINLGCGPHILEGWENLDPQSIDPRIKIWSWNKELPFPDNSAELVIAQHNTNHCKAEDFDRNLLEIMRVLEPGGKVVLKDADDRHYVWKKIGTNIDGGTIFSTLSEPKAEDILVRNGFVNVIHDKSVLVDRYESVITRLHRVRSKRFFIVEGTKPKGD